MTSEPLVGSSGAGQCCRRPPHQERPVLTLEPAGWPHPVLPGWSRGGAAAEDSSLPRPQWPGPLSLQGPAARHLPPLGRSPHARTQMEKANAHRQGHRDGNTHLPPASPAAHPALVRQAPPAPPTVRGPAAAALNSTGGNQQAGRAQRLPCGRCLPGQTRVCISQRCSETQSATTRDSVLQDRDTPPGRGSLAVSSGSRHRLGGGLAEPLCRNLPGATRHTRAPPPPRVTARTESATPQGGSPPGKRRCSQRSPGSPPARTSQRGQGWQQWAGGSSRQAGPPETPSPQAFRPSAGSLRLSFRGALIPPGCKPHPPTRPCTQPTQPQCGCHSPPHNRPATSPNADEAHALQQGLARWPGNGVGTERGRAGRRPLLRGQESVPRGKCRHRCCQCSGSGDPGSRAGAQLEEERPALPRTSASHPHGPEPTAPVRAGRGSRTLTQPRARRRATEEKGQTSQQVGRLFSTTKAERKAREVCPPCAEGTCPRGHRRRPTPGAGLGTSARKEQWAVSRPSLRQTLKTRCPAAEEGDSRPVTTRHEEESGRVPGPPAPGTQDTGQ